jgi:L,D-transpeptidase YcbB
MSSRGKQSNSLPLGQKQMNHDVATLAADLGASVASRRCADAHAYLRVTISVAFAGTAGPTVERSRHRTCSSFHSLVISQIGQSSTDDFGIGSYHWASGNSVKSGTGKGTIRRAAPLILGWEAPSMHKFLLVTAAVAVAMILPVMALAENDQFNPEQNTSVVGGSNSSTVKDPEGSTAKDPAGSTAKEPEGSTVKEPEGAANESKVPETGKPIVSAEDAVTERLQDLVEKKLQQYVPRAQDRTGIDSFYRKRNFAPLWVSAGKLLPRGQQAIDFLHGVAAAGLDPKDYPTPRFVDTDPSRLAADELTLTNSIAVFVRHASTGRVAFTRVSAAIDSELKAPDPEQVLGSIARSEDVRATLDSYNPHQPQYEALKAELASARRVVSAEPGIAAPKGRGAARIDRGESEPKAARIATIIANMERWRWLPHDLGPAYVMVNIADYTLKVVNLGKTVWLTRIVVGQPGNHATPLLTQTISYITINPTWNVPPSIIRNEYLPALERDPTALMRIGLRMGRNEDGSIRIYQPPSERNALGRIRFNFPNRFLVYQHDTPDKYLFEKTVRAYSHGCMRVENPDQYAEVLLSISQPEDRYSARRIRSLYGAGEHNINLKNPIPVYLTYQTTFVNDAGQLQTRPDIYGLDQIISELLKRDRAVADIPVARSYGSGSKPVVARVWSRPRYEVVQQPAGWGAARAPNYSQSGQNTYGQFYQNQGNYYQTGQNIYGQFDRSRRNYFQSGQSTYGQYDRW